MRVTTGSYRHPGKEGDEPIFTDRPLSPEDEAFTRKVMAALDPLRVVSICTNDAGTFAEVIDDPPEVALGEIHKRWMKVDV